MAKSHNQKAKILYLERMLKETSPAKPISMQTILDRLSELEIRAERKSIYDDMETLKDFGMEIQYRRGKEGGYYLVQEKISEAEEEINAGISGTGHRLEVDDRGISGTGQQGENAMTGNSQIKQQGELTGEGEAENIERNEVSDIETSETKVQNDGMKNPVVSLNPEIPVQEKNGKEIKLLCRNSARKEVMKALGKKVTYKLKGDDCFTVVIQTEPDRKFYGWLASMGRSVHILKPKKAAASYRDYLKSIAKDYKIDK